MSQTLVRTTSPIASWASGRARACSVSVQRNFVLPFCVRKRWNRLTAIPSWIAAVKPHTSATATGTRCQRPPAPPSARASHTFLIFRALPYLGRLGNHPDGSRSEQPKVTAVRLHHLSGENAQGRGGGTKKAPAR